MTGSYSFRKPDDSNVSGRFEYDQLSTLLKPGRWNHFAISFNKRALKFYINDVRVVNLPNVRAPERFKFWGNGDYKYRGFTNVLLCAGAIFEKWEWWEDCSTLHRNIGEFYTDNGDLKRAKPEYEKAIAYAQQSGDSLLIANAMYGLGRWYKESGRTVKALEYLTKAEEYFGEHAREESYARANTLAVMNAAHEELYRNARILAIVVALVLVLIVVALVIARRLKKTRRSLTETSAVLDETIEQLRPASAYPEMKLTPREKDIVRLLMQDKSTKMIADELGIGYETVVWYRKRLLAKFDVHTSPALISEVLKCGLL